MRLPRFLLPLLVATSVACGSSDGTTSPSTPTPTPTPSGPANIAGTYSMVISVSSQCSANLASSARTRTYQLSIAQTGGSVTGTLIGSVNGILTGTVTGTSLSFFFQVAESDLSWFLGSSQGTASVSNSPSSFSGTFSGAVQTPGGTCSAPDHKVTFTRR